MLDISATGLKDATIDDVVNVFIKNQILKGGQIKGPMAEVNNDSLRYLSRQDLLAIAVYLKTVKSESPGIPTASTHLTANTGQEIYQSMRHMS